MAEDLEKKSENKEPAKTEKSAKAEKSVKKESWFEGMKSEFKKISWPDKTSVAKQSVAVAAVSLLLGVVITLLDTVIQYGVDFLVK